MKTKKCYIFLKSNNDMFIENYLVKYDSTTINNMINTYSVKLGAHLFKRKFFGNISSYENGRILQKERRYNYRDNQKIRGLSTAPIITYNCTIIENESQFIKTLINSFEIHYDRDTASEYILLNFSSIYEMLNNNNLTQSDIFFLKELFEYFNITSKGKLLFTEHLPYKEEKTEEIAKKNSSIIKYFKDTINIY